MQSKPQRIISTRIAAKRLGISRVALAKHLRRGLVQADYQSDSACFFKSESIPALRETLEANRQHNWKHVGPPHWSGSDQGLGYRKGPQKIG